MIRRFLTAATAKEGFIFGASAHPLRRGGVTLGGGSVVPEIKFTLSPILIEESNRGEITERYSEMIQGVCRRAVDLGQNELVVEFELLPQMTVEPAWGSLITGLLRETLDSFRSSDGLKSLLRVTPADTREFRKPPLRREGEELEQVLRSFEVCAGAGADLLSIESTGGKEVTDAAIMESDLRGVIFGAGILGTSDVRFLWEEISRIADETGTVAAGDTACGIGNTAMVMADRRYIPRVFAAVVRTVCAVRSLAAFEAGAAGPGKDCAYENPFIKAVTGYPISMEGKSAACAHLSPVGNIAAAYADLWSNESIQDVRLLSGPAPVVSMEQLIYDCRLFNAAIGRDGGFGLRSLLIDSDARLDPQAYIFIPEHVERVARELIGEGDDFVRSLSIARATIESLGRGDAEERLRLPARERAWLEKMKAEADSIPSDTEQFIAEETARWRGRFDILQYGPGEESGLHRGSPPMGRHRHDG